MFYACCRGGRRTASQQFTPLARPRSRLKSCCHRRSLELVLRRRMPAAASLLVSRRARRPLSQSSQGVEPASGRQGIWDLEFIGHLINECLTLIDITILRQSGKPPNVLHAGRLKFPPSLPDGNPMGRLVPALGAGLISGGPRGQNQPITAAPECFWRRGIVSRRRRCRCRNGRCWRRARRRRGRRAIPRPCGPGCRRRRWRRRARRRIR